MESATVEMSIDFDLLEQKISAQIPELRKILQEEYNITVPAQCDKFLGRCLRLKDGNLKKAVKLAKAFHTVTSEITNWDVTLQPSVYDKTYLSIPVIYALKVRDSLGRRIFVGEAGRWDPKIVGFDEAIIVSWMLMQYAVADCLDDQRHGFVLLWDFKGFFLQQAWHIRQKGLISLGKWTQSGVAGRFKEIHGTHFPKILAMVYGAIKPFLSDKIKDRIFIHTNLDTLHEVLRFDTKHLPKLLGGPLEPNEADDKQLRADVLNSDEFFQDMINNRFPTK